ncbi:MAG: isoprenyl transferase [Chryseobacterium sp.]|nr:MAG: isoprenyl transferase [Chryseobacterium sp.]
MEEEELKKRIDPEKLPRHVAIIMDGNGRWAKNQGAERTFGHRNGIRAVRDAINACNEIHIPYLTLYTFSTENWNRPQEEVATLMTLLSETLIEEETEMITKGLRLHVIGDITALPDMVQEQLRHVMDITRDNTRGNLVLALNYGSQREIVKAVKEIADEVKDGSLQPADINEQTIEEHLYTKGIPPVDLVVRTSGEVRISNFLLWQIAYAELQFLDIYWPDFTKKDFFNCILNYQNKERRYGKTSEQIQ